MFLVLAASSVQAEFIPGSEFGHGNWEGGAYTFSGTNEFSHCAISVDFVSGDTLYFGVNSDASITVGVSSENYRLTPDQSFPVALYVDRRRPFYATAKAIDEGFAILTIEDFSAAMDAFGRGQSLRLESNLVTGHYDLTGSFRALEAARQCALKQIETAATRPPVVNNTPPKTSGTLPPPPPPSGGRPVPSNMGTLPPPSGNTNPSGN